MAGNNSGRKKRKRESSESSNSDESYGPSKKKRVRIAQHLNHLV